jgi:hypothetical protein
MFGSTGGGFSADVISVCGPLPLSSVVNQAAFGEVPESATAAICPPPVMPWSNSGERDSFAGAGPVQIGPLPAHVPVMLPWIAAMPPAFVVCGAIHGETNATPSNAVAASISASSDAAATFARTYGAASARSLRYVISTPATRLSRSFAIADDDTPSKAWIMIS